MVSQDQAILQLGINVDSKMKEVKGRLLEAPKVKSGKRMVSQRMTLQSESRVSCQSIVSRSRIIHVLEFHREQ